MNLVVKCIFVFLFVVASCNTTNTNSRVKVKNNRLKFSKPEYVDSLLVDVNFDGLNDAVRIKKLKDSTLVFEIFENKSKFPKVSERKILFKIGDLSTNGTDFISLSFENKSLIINQEYGSSSPNGWYITYISCKDNIYIVDSISNNYKDWKVSNDSVVVKRKTNFINKKLSKLNLLKEFEKLNNF